MTSCNRVANTFQRDQRRKRRKRCSPEACATVFGLRGHRMSRSLVAKEIRAIGWSRVSLLIDGAGWEEEDGELKEILDINI